MANNLLKIKCIHLYEPTGERWYVSFHLNNSIRFICMVQSSISFHFSAHMGGSRTHTNDDTDIESNDSKQCIVVERNARVW